MASKNQARTQFSKARFFEMLGYEPHQGQLLVHQSTAPRRVVGCGVRWGKTLCAAMEGLAAAMEPRQRSLGWICAPTYDLCERAFGQIVMIASEHLRHRIVTLKERERRLVLRNMAGGLSEIRGKSADNMTSLLGEGLDWLVVDEAARLKAEVWELHLSQRLVDRHGWSLFISTPKGRGWFFKLYRRGEKGDEGFASWCGPTWQNPFIDRAAIEAQRTLLSAEQFQQEYEGKFLGAELEPCDLCGGPADTAMPIIAIDDDEELPLCPVCNLAVDKQGKTICGRNPDGKPSLMVIRLQLDSPRELPPLPGSAEEARRLEALPPIGGASESSSDSAE